VKAIRYLDCFGCDATGALGVDSLAIAADGGYFRMLCIWGANLGETFGEDSPLATGVPATPATQTQPEDHPRALNRKVFQRTPIPAMARARDGLATRTGSRVLTVSFHDLTLVRLEHATKRHVAQIGEEICVR
jgi:hypothetical protein